MAALGSETARDEGETRAAAAHVPGKVVSALAEDPSLRGDALVDYATMIGAITLARIVAGSPMSDEILEHARNQLCQRVTTTFAPYFN